MKNLELDLKKKLLIVDLPEGAKDEITESLLAINLPNGDIKIIRKKVKFICKGKELTEEIAEDFVHIMDLADYVDYNHPTRGAYCHTAKESFISAIESKSFYWLENPNSKTYFNPEEFIQEEYERFMEAEAKTFKNPIIFQIL